MRRNGISFTLTIVVAGVILLMTALSIITLGGSSISQFFQTVGGEQQEQVRDADIREACNELIDEINNNYCEQYVPATYEGPYDDIDGSDGNNQNDPVPFRSGDAYDDGAWEVGDTCGTPQPTRAAATLERANNSEPAYEQTATQANCDWTNYGGLSGIQNEPMVTVDGNEFNCQEEGYIEEGTTQCPAE